MLDSKQIKASFESRLTEIETYLKWIENDISSFNNKLNDKTRKMIEIRKGKIINDQGIVSSLGYPLKQNPNLPTTNVPVIRKKILIQKPTSTTTSLVSEPKLEMENYDAIIEIISDMALVIERSPQSFANVKEEDLRQQFLVPLNSHFEGEATGETFNFEGKTDILIRHKGKNIFIAECMFWNGPKSLLEKISQLLGYTSWRDTKTAILVFNRNKDLTNVLEQIPETVKTRSNFKKQLDYKCETGYRFLLSHNTDKNRELILTILVFDIPKISKSVTKTKVE